MTGPKRSQSTMGPPGEDGPPFDIGPPGGWGPRPPGGHLPPEDWGPPPPGGWGPLPPEGWPPILPDEWDPRGPPPPDGWGPPPPGGWGPLPPRGWGSRGPAPPAWVPRGPPPPGWGGHPDDWLRPPEDWGPPHPDDWRPRHPDEWRLRYPEGWRMYPRNWSPPPDWRAEGPPEPWRHEMLPPGPLPPDAPAYAPTVPPPGIPPPCIPPPGIPPPGILPPGIPPSVGFGGYPTLWTGELAVEEVLPNPPPDQPEWIKALISAPPTESALSETKKTEEPVAPAAEPPTVAPRPKPANKASSTKALGLLAKRTFEKPPPGRSTGIISFIGPNFGYIEREDLEKYTFSFDVFFGNPKAMTPGVRVHFTACNEKGSLLATDVKVAPGGTENVDPEIYEAVVTQPIVEPQPGERQYPGQVHVTIGQLRTNLTFDSKDSGVTLLKNDQVLINLLTDIVTEKKRATNIKAKIPSTFSETREVREQGVIISLKDGEGVIKSEKHGQLPFDIKENFSDVEFTAEDVSEEVEFTVVTLRAGPRAIRIKRVKEPLLLTFCSAAASSASNEDDARDDALDDAQDVHGSLQMLQSTKAEVGPNMKLDPELYEGVVTQTIIEPSPELPGYPGQIHANIGPVKTNVTFDHRDCGITLLKNDHVLINLLYNVVTGKKRATNIKPKVPFTFSYTRELRELGIVTCLSEHEGVINTADHGELSFNTCENFSDTEFSSEDIHKEVEFTLALENGKKRAIRLMRTKRDKDPILEEQKKREEEERRKKKEEADLKRKEEEQLKETEKKRKEEAAAALEAAKCKWTPLGFKVRDPDTLEEISKERFEGTVLRAISRIRKVKKEPAEEEEEEAPKNGQAPLTQIKIKVEKMEEDEKEGKAVEEEEKDESVPIKTEKEEEDKCLPGAIPGGVAKVELGMGRLVMTVDGRQKQLPFCPNDLLSTATMFDGDRVRFNIATHPETKAERATFVEILPESFQESNEQRQHGIVIEFSENSGLIKCSQNPQLFFLMSEVLEKKKLELNEKVDFSVVPLETAEGRTQAIRIKRYSESVFLPVRKLGGVGASKGKMTIKLSKALEDTEKVKQDAEKLKAVVKSLRTRDSKTSSYKRNYSMNRHRRSRTKSRSKSKSRSRTRSKSRSPTRDEFGRTLKKRRSSSIERDYRSSQHRRSRGRSYRHSKSCSRSRSRDKSRSRDRSRSRSRDRANKKRSTASREPEVNYRRRKETPPRRAGVVEDELAQKKRELEELNEMIAYKKALVEREPGHRTCIDYDHGRIAVPMAEYRPVRSIMKKRGEGSEYLRQPPRLYEEAYYERAYGSYQERVYAESYGDPYRSHPYSDLHAYSERFYQSRPYAEGVYRERAPTSTRYTDRYDVYDQPSEERYYEPYGSRRSPQRSLPPPQSAVALAGSAQPHTSRSGAELSSHCPYRPPSPSEPPPRSPSPQLSHLKACQSPPEDKPPSQKPLDRFLDMLNKKVDAEKKSEAVYVSDDLLPHERALHDGKGFSRIVGMAPEPSSSSGKVDVEKHPSPEEPPPSQEAKSQAEPYEKIQSLLRTIGLKLSTGDVSKLASRAQEKLFSPKSSSAERETPSSSRAERHTGRTGSSESEAIHSPSPARASSLEPHSKHEAVSEYEDFLDQKELESLKKAQMLQSLTKTMGTSPSLASLRPPGPPPSHYQQPSPPPGFPLGTISQALGPSSMAFSGGSAPTPGAGQSGPGEGMSTELPPPQPGQYPSGPLLRRPPGQTPPGPPPGPPPRRPSGQTPPGPPPGPPPRRPPGQPPFPPPSAQASLPFIGQACAAPHLNSDSPTGEEQSAFSTTVARCLKVIETVKNLSAQPSPRTGKSVQFSLPTEASSSNPQSSADTDEEIRTKQKEKLDVYNQRVLEKREQQYQELLARKKTDKNKESTSNPPGKPLSSEPKNVWICGHSLVYWAESRARSPEVGMQLGMDPSKVSIWWKGTQGMTWPQLLPQLHQLKVTWPNPDVLIVHLGGNDLSTDSPTDLLASVKKNLTSVRSIFPRCILVWSNILPRRVWRHSNDNHEVDLVRTTVNRRIQTIVSDLGGVSLTHDNIKCGTNTGQYRADGVHLSHKGIDLFNLNLQDFLEKWEMSSEKS